MDTQTAHVNSGLLLCPVGHLVTIGAPESLASSSLQLSLPDTSPPGTSLPATRFKLGTRKKNTRQLFSHVPSKAGMEVPLNISQYQD